MVNTKRQKTITDKLPLVIVIIAGLFIIFSQLPPRRSSPEEAIKAYLSSVTVRYKIESIKGPESNGHFIRYVVFAYCSFWNASSQGRADGQNVYIFDLTHSPVGWYVVAANGGP